METILDKVRRHAALRGSDVAYRFLVDGDATEACITFGELDAKASAMAALLEGSGSSASPVILMYQPGLAFIVAFLGCLYAGRPPVPTSIPRRTQSLDKLVKIKQNAGARLVLADAAVFDALSERLAAEPGFEDVRLLNTDALDLSAIKGAGTLKPLGDLAFLQYTSGSTGDPKGVMVSHRNIAVNQAMIQEAFSHHEASVVVGWLPFHHDMGLLGNIMQPLFVGCSAILMSPVAFAQKPIRWLRAISKYAATTSGGPNFAYDLCTRRCQDADLHGLDLSRWQVAFNGAEPVRGKTLDAFAARFAAHGFSRKAFLPCYGMAEATLFITGARPGAGHAVVAVDDACLTDTSEARLAATSDGARALVSCGVGRQNIDVRVVDPDTATECAPGRVGEIWVAGASVAEGYWRNDAATASTFRAVLQPSGLGPFLRTGDLGFSHGGELFVTGRRKEILIIRGRNHYPHDIEATVAASHPALQGCEGAAFPVEVDGEERLVVVHEVARSHLRQVDVESVVASVREQVTRLHELTLNDLVLVRPASIPKTSSGKTQRRLCADLYRSGVWARQRLERRADEAVALP